MITNEYQFLKKFVGPHTIGAVTGRFVVTGFRSSRDGNRLSAEFQPFNPPEYFDPVSFTVTFNVADGVGEIRRERHGRPWITFTIPSTPETIETVRTKIHEFVRKGV